jgi:hypothetical protein
MVCEECETRFKSTIPLFSRATLLLARTRAVPTVTFPLHHRTAHIPVRHSSSVRKIRWLCEPRLIIDTNTIALGSGPFNNIV